jgi:hypothetical protein
MCLGVSLPDKDPVPRPEAALTSCAEYFFNDLDMLLK